MTAKPLLDAYWPQMLHAARGSDRRGEQDELADQHSGRHRCSDLGFDSVRFAGTHEIHCRQLKSERDATATVRSAPIRPDIEKPAQVSSLGIAKMRLDSPPPWENENSAVLKFQMSNDSSSAVTDIVFEVSIVEEPQREHRDMPARVLAGPFAIRGKIVLDPGYTVDSEILLRNISPTCSCVANVRVLSFRSIGHSGP